eukprot:8856223-Alexandrium_andersonii.AAC.1
MRPRPKGLAPPRRDSHRSVRQLGHEGLEGRGPEITGAPAHLDDPGMAGVRPLRVVPTVSATKDGEPHLLPGNALGGQEGLE